MRSEGNAGAAVLGESHCPIPTIDTPRRRPPAPPSRRKAGFNWDWNRDAQQAATAQTPTHACRVCHTSSTTPTVDGLCAGCREDATRRFTTLTDDLARLERTDPVVAAAAARLDDAVHRVTSPEDHLRAPIDDEDGRECRSCGHTASTLSSDDLCDGCIIHGPTQAPAGEDDAPSVTEPEDEAPRPQATTHPHDTDSPVAAAIAYLHGIRATMLAELTHIDTILNALTAATQTHASTQDQPPAPERRPTPTPAPRHTSRGIDHADIIRRYQAGDTIPTIARDLGHAPSTIRRSLHNAGIPLRDDRATHSGGTPKQHTSQLVDQVRRLYLDQGLSIAAVADRLDKPYKTISNILIRNDIERRTGQNGRQDGAAGLKQLLADHGVTSKQVRAWARAHGHPVPTHGVVPTHLVNAYLHTHHLENQEPNTHA